MEDLENAMALGFSVSDEINNPISIHPRFNCYKNHAKSSETQELRRKRFIESAKIRRLEVVNKIRRLIDDTVITRAEDNPKKKKKKIGGYLMHSEWMVEVPEDLEENYFMIVCSVGRRCVIVASRGSTKCYDVDGSLVSEFQSHLAGGYSDDITNSTVLDCIYEQLTKTYHVLDIISFRNQHVYECETEFRWYWLETKFNEDMPEALTKTEGHQRSFVPAPRFKCEKNIIKQVFSEKMNFEVDGILFYHKNHPYVFGFSPVTTWLKPYMLPEVIGVNVHETYLSNIPSWYSGFANHCEGVKKKAEDRKIKRKRFRGKKADKVEGDMEVIPLEE